MSHAFEKRNSPIPQKNAGQGPDKKKKPGWPGFFSFS
jgi:hypothetical protein